MSCGYFPGGLVGPAFKDDWSDRRATVISAARPRYRALTCRCLGTPRFESTVRYLGIEVDDALAIAEEVEV